MSHNYSLGHSYQTFTVPGPINERIEDMLCSDTRSREKVASIGVRNSRDAVFFAGHLLHAACNSAQHKPPKALLRPVDGAH